MNLKYAIFDLDGTLLDSLHVWKDVDEKFLGRRGIEVPKDYFSAIRTMKFYDTAVYTINRFGLSEDPYEIMDEWNLLAQDAYANDVKLKPYAKEFLLNLYEEGIKIGVATAADEINFIPALKNNGVYELFQSFTTLKEVQRGKGFPDIYLKAATKLECKPCECAVFEDILPGIEAASGVGFYTVGVFEEYAREEMEQIILKSDLYIESFKDLLRPDNLFFTK